MVELGKVPGEPSPFLCTVHAIRWGMCVTKCTFNDVADAAPDKIAIHVWHCQAPKVSKRVFRVSVWH